MTGVEWLRDGVPGVEDTCGIRGCQMVDVGRSEVLTRGFSVFVVV